MTEIRKSINYIRENWHLYDHFLSTLETLMGKTVTASSDPDLAARMTSLLTSRRDWAESVSEVDEDDCFDVIRVYTSPEGYRHIFSVVNAIFRKDESTKSEELIRSAVFLVELLNIDLYNYCLKYPQHDNFQGVVYRGMGVTKEDLKRFQELFRKPLPQRYISVPLGLMSSTLDPKVAERCAAKCLSETEDFEPLIMKIHVIELKPEYLQFYREKFPTSVVTGICAVNVEEIACHKEEREVILRGPFFQVLGLDEGAKIAGRRSHVLEMVMLNSNRDHVTSVRLGHLEPEARQLFGNMVA
nr:hypothetical protein BaRGS_016062 [Batillaria attramentaria]